MKASEKIGVMGLGLMGQAFATRLEDQGFTVLGYDINPEKCAEFGQLKIANSPLELANQCKTLVICLFDGQQIKELLLGEQGLLKNISGTPNNIICTSTCEPDEITLIANACESQDFQFLEMPISGTSRQVSNADSLGLMGGDLRLIEDLEPILNAMCQKRMHVGEIGMASKSKLAINLVLGLHRAALAEGLVFGSRIGLDPIKLLKLLESSAAASSVMKIKGPLMANQEYDNPQSRVDQSLKDFGLIQKLAHQANQPLTFASEYIRLLNQCMEVGEGKKDNAIIAEAIRRNGELKT